MRQSVAHFFSVSAHLSLAGAAIHYIPLQMGDKLEDQNAALNMDAGDTGGDDSADNGNGDNDNNVETTGVAPNGASMPNKKN